MTNAVTNVASTAREVAHAVVAVIGVGVASAGAIAGAVSALSGHAVTAAEVSGPIIAIGSAITLLSKLIDSANSAIVGPPPAALPVHVANVVTPPAGAPATPTATAAS